MKRVEETPKVYPKYVLTRREFKEALGITEPGRILDVSVNYYKDEVVVTLTADGHV